MEPDVRFLPCGCHARGPVVQVWNIAAQSHEPWQDIVYAAPLCDRHMVEPWGTWGWADPAPVVVEEEQNE